MRKGETLQVGVAVAVVLAATLACKPKSGAVDAGGPTTTTATAEPTVEATATTTDTASAKPTVTATAKPTATVAAGKSTYKVGDAITVTWKSSNYPATVLAVLPNEQYKIHYTGYASSWDETIGLDRVVGAKGAAAAAKADAGAAKDAGAAATAPCPGGMGARCNGVCVNLQADDKNCGACGTVCRPGTHCNIAGTCRDAAGNF
ncbi:MAG TPA: hypothetical protein VF316_17680 [Polyangiaceae bacterium]